MQRTHSMIITGVATKYAASKETDKGKKTNIYG